MLGYFWALQQQKTYVSFGYIYFWTMTSLESFKKTIADIFTWTNKQQSPNNQQTHSQKVEPPPVSDSVKKEVISQRKNPVQNQTSSSDSKNQRKHTGSISPMIKYIKTILIEEEVDCPICLTRYKKPGIVKFGQCGHEYCPPCLRQYVAERIKAFGVLKCPDEKCEHILNKDTSLYKSLSSKQKNIVNKIEKFHYTSNDPYLRMCPTENCEGIIPVIEGQQLKCSVCHNQFCRTCMYFKHPGKCTLNEVKFLNAKYRYRRCGRCGIIVQKSQACNHITCKCGYEFCYGCGRKWPGNGHHCNTTRVNRQLTNGTTIVQSPTTSQSVIMKGLKFIGQVVMTTVLFVGVVFYGGICLLPMMLVTLVSGVLVGVVVYSVRFVYDTCKKEGVGLGILVVIVFPVAMGFGVYNAFQQFWWDGFLFWWEILRQAIEKPLAIIWNT